MTNNKKKKLLSALCLATVASCAVGGITVSKVVEKAAAATTAEFAMTDGAAVSLKEGYGGIRWETKINEAFLLANGYVAGDVTASVEFGTLVAPAVSVEELTMENYQAEGSEIVNIGVGALDLSSGSATYYSAIRYDDIVEDVQAIAPEMQAEDILNMAYKMELTARSYVIINGETYYATANDVTRSARLVANAAVLAGELEKVAPELKETMTARVNGYVGAVTTAKTEIVHEIASNAPIAIDYQGDEAEVVIGAKKMNATVENGTITFAEDETLPTGECWISVFDDEGVYNIPAVLATKVLTKAEDFAIFKANNDKWDGTGTLTEGYYVLGNDVDARGYNHGASAVGLNSANIAMWADNGGKFGFTGTFDGRGHTVEGMTVSDFGIFGAVRNAVIKNVAFTQLFCVDATSKDNGNALGGFIAYTTLENVYLEANVSGKIKGADGVLYPAGIFGVVSDFYKCNLTNCVFNMGKTYLQGKTAGNYYGSFARTDFWSNDDTKMNGVYVVSDLILTHKAAKGEVDAENTSEFTSGYAGTTVTSNKIKRYETLAAMQADTTNTYGSFGELWYLENGAPTWNGNVNKGVESAVVIDMFSAMDGDIDLVKAFGAKEGDAVVLTKAYQEGRVLTVEEGKIKGVEPVFVMKDGRKDDVAVVPVTLIGTVNGESKTVSVGLKAYTRVIDEATDLAMFTDTDANTAYDSVLANSFDGYYILGDNINASAYTHIAYAWAASMGTEQVLANKYFIGLRGTFDGNGYTIDGITLSEGGLFGTINGGVVKNVSFTNVKLGITAYGALLCWYASDALVNNVYANISAYSTRGKYDGSFIGDSYRSHFENVLVVAPKYTKSNNDYGFGSFSAWYTEYKTTNGEKTTYKNTYVISQTVLCQRKLNASGKTQLLYVVDGENRTNTAVSGYTTYTLNGIKRYDTATAAGSVSGGYWNISGGAITWAKPNA